MQNGVIEAGEISWDRVLKTGTFPSKMGRLGPLISQNHVGHSTDLSSEYVYYSST